MQTTRHIHTLAFAARYWAGVCLLFGVSILAIGPAHANEQAEIEPLTQLTTKHTTRNTEPMPLSQRWELDPTSKQGDWVIRPYEPMFILPMVYTNHPNTSPHSPTHPVSPSEPLQKTEAEFQISLKVKAAQNLFGDGADLWFAYTQQSQWQVYNTAHSSPFRETDYMPEVFLVFPTYYHLLGLTGRFIRVGELHQSNGRDAPLSRSWDRVYLQLGFERGNFSLLLRPWIRIQENPNKDDNPDISHYMGYFDITAIYQPDNSELTALARFNAGHLSTVETWNFPITGRLKGYLKITTGYGETLIDYNWRQNTIGLGLLLVDWQ